MKTIPKTGMYKVTKQDAILPKSDVDKMKKSRAQKVLSGNPPKPVVGPGPKKMIISKLDDGGFHIEHNDPKAQPDDPTQFHARNPKHLTRHVRKTYGDPQEEMPSYEDGVDFVPVTGPAMLHKGEKVTPATKNPVAKTAKPYKQTPAEDKQELNNIRKYSKTPDYNSRYGKGWSGDKTTELGAT